MTRTSRSVSFTPEHYSLLDRIAHERRRGFSETLRCIVDYALDNDASLGLPFHHDRQKALQGELATVEAMINELKAKVADVPKVFEQVTNSVNTATRASPKPSFVDMRPGPVDRLEGQVEFDHNQFLRLAPEWGTLGDKAKAKMRRMAAEHQEWVAELDLEHQRLVRCQPQEATQCP